MKDLSGDYFDNRGHEHEIRYDKTKDIYIETIRDDYGKTCGNTTEMTEEQVLSLIESPEFHTCNNCKHGNVRSGNDHCVATAYSASCWNWTKKISK